MASRSALRRTARARRDPAAEASRAAPSPRALFPATRRARRAPRALKSDASRLLLARAGGLGGLARLRSHRRRPVTRPVAQGGIRALAGDGVVGGERGADLAELLPGQAQPGEGAIAIARLEGFHAADGLERLRGFLEAAELELRLAPEQERAGAKSVVVARGRRLGLSRRLSPLLSLEGSFREVVRRLMSERMIGVFLAKTGPGRLLVLDLARLARDHAGVVERFGRRRRLRQLRIRALLLARRAGLGDRLGGFPARRGCLRMPGIRGGERLELGDAGVALARGQAR